MAMKDDGLDMRVYHERQQKGASGLHTINNLLQSAALTQQDLDRIRADSASDQGSKSPRKKGSFQCWSTVSKRISKSNKENKDAKNAHHSDVSFQVVQKAIKPFGLRLVSPNSPELHRAGAAAVCGYV